MAALTRPAAGPARSLGLALLLLAASNAPASSDTTFDLLDLLNRASSHIIYNNNYAKWMLDPSLWGFSGPGNISLMTTTYGSGVWPRCQQLGCRTVTCSKLEWVECDCWREGADKGIQHIDNGSNLQLVQVPVQPSDFNDFEVQSTTDYPLDLVCVNNMNTSATCLRLQGMWSWNDTSSYTHSYTTGRSISSQTEVKPTLVPSLDAKTSVTVAFNWSTTDSTATQTQQSHNITVTGKVPTLPPQSCLRIRMMKQVNTAKGNYSLHFRILGTYKAQFNMLNSTTNQTSWVDVELDPSRWIRAAKQLGFDTTASESFDFDSSKWSNPGTVTMEWVNATLLFDHIPYPECQAQMLNWKSTKIMAQPIGAMPGDKSLSSSAMRSSAPPASEVLDK